MHTENPEAKCHPYRHFKNNKTRFLFCIQYIAKLKFQLNFSIMLIIINFLFSYEHLFTNLKYLIILSMNKMLHIQLSLKVKLKI